ncbi:O-antigen ligase family protein [Streptacidiphilus sp. ASG 303]|uniref:O-antigen ligase family protein n=1 Tax=Streptacidiphilus sp. ASG 303 TaxID=2896847 RepID=UPI001E3125D7|nr:O-antigen ligase family protein [Streptacidiphilus sp. ASG 303]MCD0483738.1 O-antigen ligase family protein [Streptacidiphilus sp. ASG 303]
MRGSGDVSGAAAARRSRLPGPDAAGAAVLAACAVWTLAAAHGRDAARPEGVLLALLAVAAGYGAGRVAGALLPAAAPAAAAVAAGLAVAAVPGGLSGGALAPPLHYGNADAALLCLGAGAACCAAWSARRPPVRVGLLLLAGVLAGLTAAVGSAAGSAAAAGTVLVSCAAARLRRRGPLLAVLALCAVLAGVGTVALARGAVPQPLRAHLVAGLSERRVALWDDALAQVRLHPLRGVGPGRFGEVSPAARADRDTAKAHSAPLQQAAEQGLPGLALLVCAFAWALWTLLRSPRPTAVALSAAAALTGLAVQACVDWVLSFAAVSAGAGLLLGLAAARPTGGEGAPGGASGGGRERPRTRAGAG